MDPDRPFRLIEVAARIEELRRRKAASEAATLAALSPIPAQAGPAARAPVPAPATTEEAGQQVATPDPAGGSAAETIAGLLRSGRNGLLH